MRPYAKHYALWRTHRVRFVEFHLYRNWLFPGLILPIYGDFITHFVVVLYMWCVSVPDAIAPNFGIKLRDAMWPGAYNVPAAFYGWQCEDFLERKEKYCSRVYVSLFVLYLGRLLTGELLPWCGLVDNLTSSTMILTPPLPPTRKALVSRKWSYATAMRDRAGSGLNQSLSMEHQPIRNGSCWEIRDPRDRAMDKTIRHGSSRG